MNENIQNIETEQQIPVQKKSYKMVTLRGMTLFPGQTFHFDAIRNKSLVALDKAVEEGQDVFFVTQKHSSTTNPAPKDIHRIGTIGKVKQVIKLQNDSLRVMIQGIKRMEIDSYTSITPFFEVTLKPCEDVESNQIELDALTRNLEEQLPLYKKLETKVPADVMETLSVSNLDNLVGVFGNFVIREEGEKQRLLSCLSLSKRLQIVYEKMMYECEVMSTERKISASVRKNIEKNQREYYLREQIKVIHTELGDDQDEINEFKKAISEKKFPEIVKEKALKELSRLEKMSPTSPESGVIRTYLELLLELPFSEVSTVNEDLVLAKQILDNDHYGLKNVKQRIIEFLAVHTLTKSLKSPILCFVGPPGVGKTSIVSSIARAAGRVLVTMSLGGVRDEAEIRGHRRTYIGAMPGRIISGMKQAQVTNPVFLLDEIDKMSSDFRGDPASALLEVLDPNQNCHFKDHYLEMDYDLSNTMFVATANTLETIPSPLLDRMEIIELSGYTYEEKLEIAKKYLVPKQLEANGLKDFNITFSDDTIMDIISHYTRESGVRSLEREIATVARKLAVKFVDIENNEKNNNDAENKPSQDLSFCNVKQADLVEYLGVKKIIAEAKNETSEVGLATGLAWTSVGGVTLRIEAVLIPDGKGSITLTGSLGDIMKESCQTAFSLVRSRAKQYNINADNFTKCDVHIHFPEGAVPKDGPSAGIALATVIMSIMTNKAVDKSVAMTGEVTLTGKVLAIGGLKEKSLAAFRHGIKKLIIPQENEKDVRDLPKEVTENLEIIFANEISTVFDNVLID